ncbi:MAG: hypothetical protein D6689_00450 [Deltaproteobacteria bacterium]|nr:MAG: hypothetical protein D6689_00450 [Deltaproteobacteria bacterium]
MTRPTAPRVAGRALRALAAAMDAPVAGRALARTVVDRMGLAAFRREGPSDAEMRPAISFRPGIRPPRDA